MDERHDGSQSDRADSWIRRQFVDHLWRWALAVTLLRLLLEVL